MTYKRKTRKQIRDIMETSLSMTRETKAGDRSIVYKQPRVFLFGKDSIIPYQQTGRIPKHANIMVFKTFDNVAKEQFIEMRQKFKCEFLEIPGIEQWTIKKGKERRRWFNAQSATVIGVPPLMSDTILAMKKEQMVKTPYNEFIVRKR